MNLRKILRLFIVTVLMLAIAVSISGCGEEEVIRKRKKYSDINEIDEYPINDIQPQGKMYKRVSLKDPQAGIIAFQGLLAEGWTASIQSNWNVVSYMCPGLESVTLTSPDGMATIVLESQQVYTADSKYAEGVNYDYYTTYYHYMDADTFVQAYMDQMYSESTLVADLDDDPDILKNADEYIQAEVAKAVQENSWINSGGYGLDYSLTAIPSTMSKRQYQYGNKYMEGSCVIVGADSVLNSVYIGAQTSRIWMIPYSILYVAESKDAFDKYYDDYSFMVANSNFTTDYYAIIEYVSSKIVNTYTSYYAAKSQAGLDAMNEYINSNYSSTSSQSTNDKVMEMWDDYIKDVDCYKTEDGTKIKTSIFNDVVAQDGDNFYVGTKAGIPYGYTELAKSY